MKRKFAAGGVSTPTSTVPASLNGGFWSTPQAQQYLKNNTTPITVPVDRDYSVDSQGNIKYAPGYVPTRSGARNMNVGTNVPTAADLANIKAFTPASDAETNREMTASMGAPQAGYHYGLTGPQGNTYFGQIPNTISDYQLYGNGLPPGVAQPRKKGGHISAYKKGGNVKRKFADGGMPTSLPPSRPPVGTGSPGNFVPGAYGDQRGRFGRRSDGDGFQNQMFQGQPPQGWTPPGGMPTFPAGAVGPMGAMPGSFGPAGGLPPKYVGYKKGGHIKPNELKGKAKETKSIAKEEMKALKRGHAPKEVMKHEKAEHEAMGYKKGGKIHPAKVTKAETKQKGFAMAETKGGRKPPHGKHSSEGDTKLKGFGMKKGGHVKKHTKHMKRGGVSARRMAPPMAGGLPAALASAAPAPGMTGPPMPGMTGPPMPGMKKGGNVIHHHHHYAKGGSVRPGIDEKAERGHTKGKQVKMASGGHVGSHPNRRVDGIATKGHTKGRVC